MLCTFLHAGHKPFSLVLMRCQQNLHICIQHKIKIMFTCNEWCVPRADKFKELITIFFKLKPLKILMRLPSWPPKLKATRCTEQHVIRHIDRSTHFCTVHSFTQLPKSYALQCFSIGQTCQKCPFQCSHLYPNVIHVPWTHLTQHSKLQLDRFTSFSRLMCDFKQLIAAVNAIEKLFVLQHLQPHHWLFNSNINTIYTTQEH